MNELIIHNKPKSPISESYRRLRTNIDYANIDKNIKSIVVTSATPGEGKTTTLLNLAIAMVQDGKKVLVIDCDLRKPRVHKVLKISNKKGLTKVLLSDDQPKTYIQPVEDLGLDVLNAGKIPGNPSELLNSNKMKEVLEELKKEYDYVFIDTPPVMPVTDAALLTRYTDGVVLVLASGQVDIEVAKKVKEGLKNVDAHILGVVLNKMPVNDKKTYQSYYYYYGEKEEEK